MFVDFHSHILPGMDDGSRDVEESLALLRASAQQGTVMMAATPHFYADQNSPERFLQRRRKAWERLECALAQLQTETEDQEKLNQKQTQRQKQLQMPGRFDAGFEPGLEAYTPETAARGTRVSDQGLLLPQIVLGAEVRYFRGIARMDEARSLRIEGTKLILLEMPFEAWTSYMVEEVIALNRNPAFQVVMAHIERYIDDQPRGTVEELLANGIFIQSNATFFLERSRRRQALQMLKKNQIQILGSDCHNVDVRPPKLGEAARVIAPKLGEQKLAEIADFSAHLLKDAHFMRIRTQKEIFWPGDLGYAEDVRQQKNLVDDTIGAKTREDGSTPSQSDYWEASEQDTDYLQPDESVQTESRQAEPPVWAVNRPIETPARMASPQTEPPAQAVDRSMETPVETVHAQRETSAQIGSREAEPSIGIADRRMQEEPDLASPAAKAVHLQRGRYASRRRGMQGSSGSRPAPSVRAQIRERDMTSSDTYSSRLYSGGRET